MQEVSIQIENEAELYASARVSLQNSVKQKRQWKHTQALYTPHYIIHRKFENMEKYIR